MEDRWDHRGAISGADDFDELMESFWIASKSCSLPDQLVQTRC